ncbi:alpha/beta fold hydrolase [Corynebacterium halotolerans]|uniref:Alpha/beta hydrolase fold protein n=1 Tax=Corynebacterium halotolerans YIM 70093 = DSM 44683 TaxID=1121362 RepID=M1MWD2_9CORY|nr:alpha/beta hydrolase [Corynebacterium halotolerans]AGF72034.1 alpha/beta hydrolase fold protein [Corynebacterium halotolerans YIM 70093 = DSM 44683]
MADSALLEPGWRETMLTANGVRLHVVEAGEPDAPLVLLLHGFPEFWWGWRRQINALAEVGYHVVVPDLRGYNDSEVPQGVAAYQLDILADDVVALADAYDADRFHLVGHDWGGVISWWVAARHPERLRHLVVMDAPHPGVWLRQVLRHPSQALRSTYAAFFQLPLVPEAVLGSFNFTALRAMMRRTAREGTFDPGDLDRYAAAWSHPGSLTGMLNYYRALVRREEAPPARITPPTLILWGENDAALELHIAERALELCDDGRLVVVENASHWLHLEQPHRINAELVDFLGKPGLSR